MYKLAISLKNYRIVSPFMVGRDVAFFSGDFFSLDCVVANRRPVTSDDPRMKEYFATF